MYPLAKRFIDVILSLIGLAVVALLTPFISLAIKLDSRGPVFFKAHRVSQGREIVIYKFRTMVKDASRQKADLKHLNERADSPFFKMKNDPRITRVGRYLRKFWLDELPQLWNVLRGDLSLVGPRPYEPEEIAGYPEAYAFLKYEKAGLTGLSQVNGSSNLSFEKVLAYDAFYARHKSLWLDFKILFKTLLLFLHPSGV